MGQGGELGCRKIGLEPDWRTWLSQRCGHCTRGKRCGRNTSDLLWSTSPFPCKQGETSLCVTSGIGVMLSGMWGTLRRIYRVN